MLVSVISIFYIVCIENKTLHIKYLGEIKFGLPVMLQQSIGSLGKARVCVSLKVCEYSTGQNL